MQDGQLGICVVGCGDMGTKHAERWQKLPEARVVAVCDILPERAAKLGAACGLERWYGDYREAVAAAGVDVVSVCVPTCLHPAVTLAAVEQGRHVLSEKPIALSAGEAAAMTGAAARRGVKLALGFMRRYSPVLAALRGWLTDGGPGRSAMYHALDARELRPKRAMHDAEANGGPVLDMGVHLYDTWAYLFASPPAAVYAQGHHLAAGRPEIAGIRKPAVDSATVQVRYASGDTGTFVATWGLPPGVNPPGSPEVLYGPRGAAYLQWGIGHQEARLLVEGGGSEILASSDADMYESELAAVAACILEDRPLPAGGAEGQAALKVALAALESMETGQIVTL